MADSTKYPALTELAYFQWATVAAPNPTLNAPIDSDDATLAFSSAPLDKDGAVITAPFLMGIKTSNSYVETVYCPNGADGASGLSATGCIRGVELAGIDYTAGDSSNATSHVQGEPIFCNITAVMQAIFVNALQGVSDMATGGLDFVIGDETDSTVTIKRGNTSVLGFLRFNFSTLQTQYSNDGIAWVNLTDVSASDLVKVSANDTTPGYLNGKLVAGDNVTLTENNDGGNETLTVAATSQRDGITTHIIYTPGFLTGGTSAESNFAVWNDKTDGSFRITIDGGGAQNVDGIDFTGDASMADVAATIQAALRVVTSSTETVVWSTDHFIITSANTTSSSAIAVLETSTGTVGTDISGAGASDWMDADTGNGVATAAVLDPTADVGKVGLLDATGKLDETLLDLVDISARIKFGGDGSDGVQGDSNLTITGSNDTYIVKNFSSWTAGSVARTCTITPTGCVLHIKVSGDADFTNWDFDFVGKGGPGGAQASSTQGGFTPVSTITPLTGPVALLSGGGLVSADTATNGGGGGGGGASHINDGVAGSDSGATSAGDGGNRPDSYMLLAGTMGRRAILMTPGSGGSAGGGGLGVEATAIGGAGGPGGGCVIIEVAGDVILSSTTASVAGGVGSAGGNGTGSGNKSGGGGGGGGGGGQFLLTYDGSLSGSVTPTVSGGGGAAGGTGIGTGVSGGAGGVGGAGEGTTLSNTAF